MFSYVQSTLQMDEEVLIMPRVHWIVFFDKYLNLSILYTCFCLLMTKLAYANFNVSDFFWRAEVFISILLALRLFYMWMFYHLIEMAVTNYRAVCKKGVFSIKTDELELTTIESVYVNQSFFGRVFHYGDVLFSSNGASRLKFATIYAPYETKKMIETIILNKLKK